MQVCPETFILFVTRGPMIYGQERKKSLCNTSPVALESINIFIILSCTTQ